MNCAEWIALADVIITAFLTILIICQTKQLSKQQLMLEEREGKLQRKIQENQIRIETSPYKREVYVNTFAVFEFCNSFLEYSEKINLSAKTGKEIGIFYDTLRKQFVPNTREVLWNLREAEYLLPKNIADVVLEIRTHFDNMCAHLMVLPTIEEILTVQELQFAFQETKEANLLSAKKECEAILGYVSYIENVLPREISISKSGTQY